ncbi:MAG: sigma-54 dependent transcriptional regulator [Candidatus Acidiferrales bacterium]
MSAEPNLTPAGTSNPKVAVIDTDESFRSGISADLGDEFEIFEGDDFEDAYHHIQESGLDVLLLGLPLPSGSVRESVQLLGRLAESDIDTLVIVLNEDSDKAPALKLIEAGCYDYFVKPVDTDVVRALMRRAIKKLHIQRENRILREEVSRKQFGGDLIGSTDSMRDLLETIRRMARASTSVIIRGESGTGKELVARALHEQGPRRTKPFISVNCAALPETLMEAELFGYERGAFTGAVATKEGRIELANHGTLFLDEIATLTPALQSKLLRVLEDHALIRLGGKKSFKVDFRLVSATNENLEEMAKTGRFREDLYYRIHVVPIFIPPLRERVDDIPLLIDYFVSVYCAANRTPVKRIAEDALQALKRYAWPGNVRELQNVVQRFVLMTDADMINLKDLPSDVVQAAVKGSKGRFRLPAGGIKLNEELDAFERQWVETALAQADQVKSEAARLLGVDRNRINYLCRKYDL